MLTDGLLQVCEIVRALVILHGSVVSILNECLGKRKPPPRWVPCFLIIDHKCRRVETSKGTCGLFSNHENDFLRLFVSVKKTWIYHKTPETKQSRQKVSSIESPTKKAEVGHLVNQDVVPIF